MRFVVPLLCFLVVAAAAYLFLQADETDKVADEQARRIETLEDRLHAAVAVLDESNRRAWIRGDEDGSPFPPGIDCAMPLPHGRHNPPPRVFRGSVLATDTKANVHVISLGSEDGLVVGDHLIVSRDGSYVGIVKITDVQASQGAGRSLPELEQRPIRRNDRVTNEP